MLAQLIHISSEQFGRRWVIFHPIVDSGPDIDLVVDAKALADSGLRKHSLVHIPADATDLSQVRMITDDRDPAYEDQPQMEA